MTELRIGTHDDHSGSGTGGSTFRDCWGVAVLHDLQVRGPTWLLSMQSNDEVSCQDFAQKMVEIFGHDKVMLIEPEKV